ncbi:MAG: Tol-Pal system beta propeller repeat protein TolB [Zoogloeaceae bacterium]|jgi:TolB protein|nr:Tol-Pal system beta propeller repeat protein TolB [Zoogloeaceae bacterium]
MNFRLFPRVHNRAPHAFAIALLAVVFALPGLAPAPARAQLSIEITGASEQRVPVAIADFGGETTLARALTSVVKNDLEMSGLFRLVEPGGTVFTENTAVDYGDWKNRGADALVAGSLGRTADGRLEARFRLHDINRQIALGGAAYVTAAPQLRVAGHRIADYIYEKLTGEKGIFSTRIAFVLKSAGRYRLQIADADGQNVQTALVSNEPLMSPAWSPEGSRLAYVSFENKKPIVFVHSLATGGRQVVANFKGSNSAPAWSPDGQRLAVVLSRDGHSQIYTISANGSAPQRLTSSAGIDTEPHYSADGAYIYFTSDRGGSPQIYRVGANGGAVERITFEGGQNMTPRPSPDGKSLAFITSRNGRFQLALMDLASRQTRILSSAGQGESPSFAPNGRVIVLASEAGGRGVLTTLATDGRNAQRLSVTSGDVREPAWGPFPR